MSIGALQYLEKVTDDRGIVHDVHAFRESEAWKHSRALRIFTILASVITVLMLVDVTLGRFNGHSLQRAVAPGLVVSLIWVGWWASRRQLPLWLGRRSKRTMLKRGLCSVCRYELARLPQDSDTCVRCPECGAVWKA